MALDYLKEFKLHYLVINDHEDRAICLDFPTMIKELIACVDREIKKLDAKTVSALIGHEIQRQINDLVNEAKGCHAMCLFCNRKCELKPHNDEVKHNCSRKGHQMRVFGGGYLLGPSGKYPSLKVCDEIEADTVIIIERAGKKEKVLWRTIHDTQNLGWKRDYLKYTDANKTNYNPIYLNM